jgi:hypothetical protein
VPDVVKHLRWAAGVAVTTALVLATIEFIPHGATPLLSRLSSHDRVELYKQVATATASLLGFLIAAVAILVSLDVNREIVQDLKRGESFTLLIVNLLAAIVFLFLATIVGIIGAIFDDGKPGSDAFELAWELLVLAGFAELALGLFFFAIVTYKVAKYE